MVNKIQPLFDGDCESLIKEAQKAAMCNFNYKINNYCAEIIYRSIDSESLMKIISGLIFVGFRHIDIAAGYIKIYFDSDTMMVVHWN